VSLAARLATAFVATSAVECGESSRVPSKFAYSGASPVTGCVVRWKKSRLVRAASRQNARSSAGPHRAHSS
jgi:hypothetical protein